MTRRPKVYLWTFAIVIIFFACAYFSQRGGELLSVKPQVTAQVRPASTIPSINAVSAEVVALDIPFSAGERQAIQLLEQRLLPVPNNRAASLNQVEGKSAAQLISEMGNLWLAMAESSSGAAWSQSGPLLNSVIANPLLIRLIEEGRTDPERIGRLISANLHERVAGFPDRFKQFHQSVSAGRGGGYVSEHGQATGNTAFLDYEADRYAIQASLWVLANIESEDGLGCVRELLSLCQHRDRYIVPKRDMMANSFSPEFIAYSFLAFAGRSKTASRDADVLLLKREFEQMPVTSKMLVKGSRASWPNNDSLPVAAGVNMSSEPKLLVQVPNLKVLSPALDYTHPPGTWFKQRADKFKFLDELATANAGR